MIPNQIKNHTNHCLCYTCFVERLLDGSIHTFNLCFDRKANQNPDFIAKKEGCHHKMQFQAMPVVNIIFMTDTRIYYCPQSIIFGWTGPIKRSTIIVQSGPATHFTELFPANIRYQVVFSCIIFGWWWVVGEGGRGTGDIQYSIVLYFSIICSTNYAFPTGSVYGFGMKRRKRRRNDLKFSRNNQYT